MQPLLEIDNLECVYEESILAVNGVSLVLQKGQIVVLLGTNGAGKTTTLRCIMGKDLLKSLRGRVNKGSILLNGEEILPKSTPQVVKMGISLVPEGRGIFEDMTVEENLRVGAYPLPRAAELLPKYEKIYAYFPQLRILKRKIAGYLSGGEQQMLAIGRALMATPTLLIVDEASLGLAPVVTREIFDILKSIRDKEGVSVLAVEQQASAALEMADYCYVMENGRIVLDGPPDKLKNDPSVKEFYLGISSSGDQKNYQNLKSYKKRKRWFS
jgi:branched-chain amino acid transport system ATP-binding protein